MAESSPTPPKMDSPRSGLIDTAAPFESVKAAVSLFGEKADFGDSKGWKVPSSAEKRASLEVDGRRAQEELAQIRHQLAETEKAKSQAIQELEAVKLTCSEKTKALEEAEGRSLDAFRKEKVHAGELLDEEKRKFDETRRGQDAELTKVEQLLSEVTDQLKGAKQEVESLKQEHVKLKEGFVKEVEGHLEALNQAKKEREAAEVSHQQEKGALQQKLSRCEEILAGINAALANLQEDKAALVKKHELLVAASGTSKQEIEDLQRQVEDLKQQQAVAGKEFESKLASATSAIEKLEKDVVVSKEAESKSATDAAESKALLRKLEAELASATAAIEKLEKDLLASKEAETQSATDAAESKALVSKLEAELGELKAAKDASDRDLEQTGVQLRKLQEEEASLRGAFATVQSDYDKENSELQELKVKHSKTSMELQQSLAQLKNLREEEAALRAALASLQIDFENEHAELVDVKVKETRAAEENASLTGELEKMIEDLTAVTAAEAKAKEQVGALTDALQQVTTEADLAKKAVAQSTEEAAKAKADAEQAKAALSTCESRLQAALKEVEAAQAAETLALSENKSLKDRLNDNGEVNNVSSDKEAGGEVSISREEYDALQRKIVEVEDLAKKKVDAALAQVGAAQAGEREMLTRLHAALADLDISREAAGVALKRAEKAEEAKSKIEGELRKHRSGNELRRKNADHSRELGVGAGTPPKHVERSDVESARDSFALPTPGSARQSGELVYRTGRTAGISDRQSESLGQFLNMVIPQEKQVIPVIPETPKSGAESDVPTTRRKKTLQSAIKAIFARSKTRRTGHGGS